MSGSPANPGRDAQLQSLRREYRAVLGDFVIALADWNFRLYVLSYQRKISEKKTAAAREIGRAGAGGPRGASGFSRLVAARGIGGSFRFEKGARASPENNFMNFWKKGNMAAANRMLTAAMAAAANKTTRLRSRLQREKALPRSAKKTAFTRSAGSVMSRAGRGKVRFWIMWICPTRV